MDILTILLLSIGLLSTASFSFLLRDLYKHRGLIKNDPGKSVLQAITAFFIYFFATFGVSDFALATVIYNKAKWVGAKKLPGTLNVQCLAPTALMALSYMSSVDIEISTLLPCMAAQMIGAYIGPHFTVRINANVLKKILASSLLVAGFFIIASKFGLWGVGGDDIGLRGFRLALMTICFLILGILRAVGVGTYAPAMALVYLFGLNPIVAYPLMTASSTFATVAACIQFIRLDSYSRRVTLFASSFGLVGVVTAVFLVKNINIALLQWIVAVVIIFTSFDMLLRKRPITESV